MSLSDLTAICGVISTLAVVVSLVYLALQIRQNSKHTQALIHQGYTANFAATFLELSHRDLATAWIEGSGDSATAQAVTQYQFFNICMVRMRGFQDVFEQHGNSLMGDERFNSIAIGARVLLQQPNFLGFWKRWKALNAGRDLKFVGWMDSLAGEGEKLEPIADRLHMSEVKSPL